MNMKVLLVNGSPHEKGCTYTALGETAKTLNEERIATEVFWIGTKPLSGCVGCKACVKLGRCVFNDCVNDFIARAAEADGFIFGTPVHYAAAGGAMTAFMDRAFYSAFLGGGNRAFYLKPAAAVLSARRAGTTSAFDQINKYFALHEMPIVSSRYWNMVFGAKPEDVLRDEEGLYTMRVLARNMAFLLKCKKAGLAGGVEPPRREEPRFTNFIR